MTIASIWKVPQYIRDNLRAMGVEVIENVYPGGSGKEAIVEFVERSLE